MLSVIIVNEVGVLIVFIRLIRFEKDRVIVCLVVKVNGYKFKLFIVFKGGKRDVKRMNEDR